MKKISLTLPLLLSLTTSLPHPVFAQNSDNEGARIEKVERDLMLLQRQMARSPSGASISVGSGGSVGNDIEVRLSAIEEQMRTLLGKTEENEFKVKKLSENLDKLQRDTDFRFGELSNTQTNNSAPQDPASAAAQRKIPDGNLKVELDKNGRALGKIVDTEGKQTQQDSSDDETSTETDFSTSRDHYNYAFRLLNQTQYDKAAESFAAFVKKYPKDPLIGNAYYWQGETFYIRRDYVKAADSFRQGFEDMPNGPKAPDNLLKLAMTLDALKRNKEACIVLGQVVTKFKTSSAAVAQKAEQEQKRIDCK